MSLDFHKDMDKYLASKRRKKRFSNIKLRIMNKRAVVSYKTKNKFGKLKSTLKKGVEKVKDKRKPKKEIRQEQIDVLVEGGSIKKGPLVKGKGWKEIKIQGLKKEEDLVDLEEKRRKIQEKLSKTQEKEQLEKDRLVRLNEENEQREKTESGEDRIRRLELEEEVNILKEKQKIEEGRLDELRKARRKEQMEALGGRVKDILFKKKSKIHKGVIEDIKKEHEEELGVDKEELKKPEVSKAEEKPKKMEEEVKKIEKKEEKPKKSFFSNFIQIKTGEEIAKEERERLKMEEKRARRDHLEINKMLQGGDEEISNIFMEGEINLSTLFPKGKINQKQTRHSDDVIELDQGYKIKVIKNQ